MVEVEPVVGAPAATVTVADELALLVADYHAGIERAMRYRDGISIHSRAKQRRQRLLGLVEETGATHVIMIGDLMHSIGDPLYSEQDEIETLLSTLPSDLEFSLIKGNHDGAIESWVSDVTVHQPPGTMVDGLALSHGHTWPPADALSADILVIGHEHPRVRLEDSVGGATVHRVWLRGRLQTSIIADHLGIEDTEAEVELVVMPAFNELSGGTWVNVPDDTFLVPYLPDALIDTRAYMLDGTDLGPIETGNRGP